MVFVGNLDGAVYALRAVPPAAAAGSAAIVATETTVRAEPRASSDEITK
jgi:hypothetical protein